MSLREEHQRSKKQAIRKAIDVLRGDAALDNLELTILSIKQFPEEVQQYLLKVIAEVQNKWVLQIAKAAIVYLEEKLDRMERDGWQA